MRGDDDRSDLRLAELVAALSLGIDLGFGQPMEHVLRQCLIALRLADRVGLDDQARAGVYYTALLVNVACHSDAHEQAKWFGDDIALKADKYAYAQRSVQGTVATMRRLGAGNPPLHRFRTGLEFALGGFRDLDGMIAQHATLARSLGDKLGLPVAVLDGLGGSYERWDGKGWPGDLAGDEVPISSRIAQLAEYAEVAHRTDGVDAAVALAERGGGTQFDPTLVRLFCDDAQVILDGLDEIVTWDAVIAGEPALAIVVSGETLEDALRAIAAFVDLKSPYTLGHSEAVADLVGATAAQLKLSDDQRSAIYRAGLVCNFGRLGVSNAIWDKRGPLGAGEWERVRMHPYFSERMLQQSDALAPLARIVGQFRERMDGSGYPRGLSGSAISAGARILGACDAYQAMCEPRPYRRARSPEDAAAQLLDDAKAGRLDGEVVAAVLAATGHRVPRRRDGPAGLTAREIEVLRLLARGLSAKQIAAQLVISPKTARNHVEHIYSKTGTSNRVTASLFAMQHGLLPSEDAVAP